MELNNKKPWAIHPDILSASNLTAQAALIEQSCFATTPDEALSKGACVLLDIENKSQQLRLWHLKESDYPPFTTQNLLNDWLQRKKTLRNKQELLSKAFGLGKKNSQTHQICDLTSGFGKDSFTLASLGAHVHLIEQEAIIAYFVAFAVNKGLYHPELSSILKNMQCIYTNAFVHDVSQSTGIYCDPMFEHSKNKSSKNKLSMQLLQTICSPHKSHELCEYLIQRLIPGQRLVIKKSARQALIQHRLNFQINGKAMRYDIYL